MQRSKLASYVGFAVKSGSVIFGEEAIGKHARRCKVVLLTEGASEKLAARVRQHAEGICEVFILDDLSALVHRDNVKAIGITDPSLAAAMTYLLR